MKSQVQLGMIHLVPTQISEKLTLFTPETHKFVRIRGEAMLGFAKIQRVYYMDDLLVPFIFSKLMSTCFTIQVQVVLKKRHFVLVAATA